MPPNGWNCRCTAVQVRRGKYPQTDIAEAMERGEAATADDKRGMMRFNPGKERSVWPAYNPYTTTRCRDCDIAKGKGSFARTTPPENDMCAVCWMARECKKRNEKVKKPHIPAEKKNAILAKPYEEQFDVIYEGKKGKVFQHLLHCVGAIAHQRVEDAAKAFADNVGDCWINPEVHIDSPMRHIFYHDLPTDARCNPDLRVRGIGYVDVKSPEGEHTCCSNAIHASNVQYSCACITDHVAKSKDREITMENVSNRNKLIWNDPNYHHDYLFWLIDGRFLKFERP